MFLRRSSKNKFHGSFYQLFGCSVVMYLFQSIVYYLGLRFPYITAFLPFLKNCPQTSVIYVIIYMCDYYGAAALPLYSLALSFNRFTVFILSAKYKKFWNRFFIYILGLCFFIPFLAIWHFPFLNIQCIFIPTIGAAIYPFNSENIPWFSIAQILFIEIFITSLLSLAMNLYVILKLIQRNKNNNNNNNLTMNSPPQISSQDKKMFIYSLLIFLTELCSCIQQFLMAFWYDIFISFVTSTQFYLIDVTTLAPAWFILATNKQLRYEIMNLVFSNSNQLNTTTINISNNSRMLTTISTVSHNV